VGSAASGSDRGDGVQQRHQQLCVVGVGRGDQHGQRQAAPVAQDVNLRSGLATVDRVGSGFGSPFRSYRDRVHHGPGPVDPADHPEVVPECLVQPLPQSGVGPLGEPAVCGGPADSEQLRGQLGPGAAGLDQVHDRGQYRHALSRRPTHADREPEPVRAEVLARPVDRTRPIPRCTPSGSPTLPCAAPRKGCLVIHRLLGVRPGTLTTPDRPPPVARHYRQWSSTQRVTGPMWDRCVLGSSGTERHRPASAGSLGLLHPLQDNKKRHRTVPQDIDRYYLDHPLNPRVRGSSPWRRTRSEQAV
jgi:hypothetical protein